MIETISKTNITVKPFLRWAGGKRWLLKEMQNFLPKDGFNQYHEPFLGGGSVFFHFQQKPSYLSDINIDLINTYLAIKNNIEDVIKHLTIFKNTEEDYYRIRTQKFSDPSEKAAQFIYLNYTSFNGIYRVNLKGEYNVPYGKRKTISFNYENLRKAHEALQNTEIKSQDFWNALDDVKEGDLVFLDPPYTVTHNDNGFIKYNQKLFSLEQQYRLAEMIKEIRKRNAYYILTNAAHPKVKEIFSNGDSLFELERNSLIGGKKSIRGKYKEIVLTNGVV